MLSQSAETEELVTSEDSDEEDQANVSEEMKKLYWDVRNHESNGRNLCEHFMALPEKA